MNRKILGIVGIVVLIVVLAGGAYTAVQLAAAQSESTDLPSGAMVFEDVMDDGSGNPVTVKTVILPAEGLPKRAACWCGRWITATLWAQAPSQSTSAR